MTDHLDSRALRNTDCFGQRLMRPGRYRYGLVSAGVPRAFAETGYTVTVEESSGAAMTQHTVHVRFDGKSFEPDQPELTVAAGDLIVWNCRDAGRFPFAVVGDKDFLDSRRLVNECGFSHAFAVAGEYRWVDAYGSGLGGVVRVADPGRDADLDSWRTQLTRATVVMINDGRAEPAEVDIVTGQTVYFAVVIGGGVSVTDERVVQAQQLRATAS